jgi:hypothetical protein
MKKMILFLSVFTLVSICEAKTYFSNKSPFQVKFEFDNLGAYSPGLPNYDTGRYKDSMTPFAIQPGKEWGADTALDFLKWVKLFVDFGNGKFQKIDERDGIWPVAESRVVVVTSTDSDGNLKPKLVINGE